MKKIKNYIGGKLVEPVSGKYMDNIEPATGEVYSHIPDSDEKDVQLAVDAAEKARYEWATMPIEKRSAMLMKVADLIDENLDLLAKAESIDNGKPISLSREVDIPRASSNFRFYAAAIVNQSTQAHITADKGVNYTLREPVGIAGCISPWNLPLYLFTWKIAPALASGNCVVAKPSEITPMSAFLLSELCIKAGLPAGVLNIVHGLGPKVGEAIISHPNIPAISFTGGTATGKRIASIAAPMFKKLSLELGGKNPNIIFDDCDFEDALATTIRSSFSNQGQICLCGSRIYVQKGIYDKFLDAFVAKVTAMKVGDPLDEKTKTGAVVSEQHQEKILHYISLAQLEGGKVVAGGNAFNPEGRCRNGYFVQPTVITGLDESCRTNQEEIFGPVVTVQPFETEEEVIALANSTNYGLSATVWTQNLTRAHRVGAALKSGIIWINCWLVRDLRTPFGGMKQSGVGREGGDDALNFFTEAKNICIKV
ncbi:MAG: aldehyde dehydrogenase [Cyclobacteriaceae bacterium]|nr:aldehyde dehydrogenase [Cyclobacteriaceae bacterium]